jgi:hypothetical protein
MAKSNVFHVCAMSCLITGKWLHKNFIYTHVVLYKLLTCNDDMANWLGSHVFVDMAWEPTQMMIQMWGRDVDAMSDDDLNVRSWRRCHVTWWPGCKVVTWMPRNATWNLRYHGLPRLFNMFTTTLYDYRVQVPTSRPQRLSVHYKSFVITQKLLVIVILNDSNNNHKQSRFLSIL